MRSLFVIVAAALAAGRLAAQSAETIEVHVIELEASVLDAKGQPVEGLKPEDFIVELGGRNVAVTNLYYVRGGAVVDSTAPAKPQRVPARLAIIVDDEHLDSPSKLRAMPAVERALDETLGSGGTASLSEWNLYPRLLTPMTRDRKQLVDALQSIATVPPQIPPAEQSESAMLAQAVGDTNKFGVSLIEPDVARLIALNSGNANRSRSDGLMLALGDAVTQLEQTNGRRLMLLIARYGLPPTIAPTFRAFIDRLRAARIAFLIIDPAIQDPQAMQVYGPQSFEMLARETGGSYHRQEADLTAVATTMLNQMTSYYSLGVRAPEGNKPFSVSVRVRNRPELRVLTASQRRLVPESDAIAATVRDRLEERDQKNPLDVRVAMLPPRRDKNRCVAVFQVVVPTAQLTLLPSANAEEGRMQIRFAVADDRGHKSDVRTIERNVRASADGFVRETFRVGLLPRKHAISIAITDVIAGTTSYLQNDIDASACK
jgi:VWFA-related protein